MDNKKYQKMLEEYDKHCELIRAATEINIHETAQERKKRIDKTEKDYITWFEYYFPNYASYKCAWFHKNAADIIIKNKRVRCLCEWYRSAAKSVHIDMGIPLYLYLVKRDIFFMLIVGETDVKAKKLLSDIQAQLTSNRRLIWDYGEKYNCGDWADGDFTTSDGVKFTAIGFGSSPRGSRSGNARPDYIVCDDIDSRKHVNNDRMMEDGISYISEDVWGCFDKAENATSRFVYANNNFHKNSITNRLKSHFNTSREKDKNDGIDRKSVV